MTEAVEQNWSLNKTVTWSQTASHLAADCDLAMFCGNMLRLATQT